MANGSRLARARARVYDAPAQEANRKHFESLVGKALQITEDIIETGDPREQLEASRLVLQAWVRVIEGPAQPTPGPVEALTAEQWQERAEVAERDPAVRAFLKNKGWKEPANGSEQN